MRQANFLDNETGLTGQFQLGKPEPVTPQPTPAQKSEQVAKILEVMEYARQGNHAVSEALLIEICGWKSYRQRLSDARKILQKKGRNIVCRHNGVGNEYFNEPYQVK